MVAVTEDVSRRTFVGRGRAGPGTSGPSRRPPSQLSSFDRSRCRGWALPGTGLRRRLGFPWGDRIKGVLIFLYQVQMREFAKTPNFMVFVVVGSVFIPMDTGEPPGLLVPFWTKGWRSQEWDVRSFSVGVGTCPRVFTCLGASLSHVSHTLGRV